jgi:FeS assembly protein IscX
VPLAWSNAEEIGFKLLEKYPDINPLTARFTDLHRYVIQLEGFADDPLASSEGKLEAIQMAWYEEWKETR